MDPVSPALLWELFKHLRSWLSNLSRAGQARRKASVTALRNVIIAARETQVYMRQLEETQTPHHASESRLATLWTQLGFELSDLGLNKLAKRCHITGKNWADPAFYDEDFLQKADVSLEQMEKLAQQILLHMDKD